MLSFLSFLFFLFLIGKNFFSLLFYLYLWQLKEYRLDRFISHLRTKEGKRQILSCFNIFNLRRPKRPKLTLKITLLFLSSLALSFHFFFVFWQIFFDLMSNLEQRLAISSLLGLVSLNIFSLLLVSLLVFLFSPLTILIKNILVLLAKAKLKHYPRLSSVGITGSYGKTSTKESLSTLLSLKYAVLATKGTQNTEIAIARTLLFNLKKHHQILVAEMGAYKKGEISAICQIVKPHIGVLTGINEQHLSLFGSLKNTIKAKNELIKSLPPDGLAVFNGDNSFCRQLAQKTRLPHLLYSAEEKSDVSAEKIKVEKESVSFDLKIDRQKTRIHLRLCGRQNVANFLAAAAVADHLGISLPAMARQAKKIKPLPGTMFLIKKKRGVKIIDDSFSSNPHGFHQALNYLKLYDKEKKIIITPGIIELGPAASRLHQNLGEKIGQISDYLILTNDNFKKPLSEGAFRSGMKKEQLIVEDHPEKIVELIKKFAVKKAIILIEGRIPEKTKRLLINNF